MRRSSRRVAKDEDTAVVSTAEVLPEQEEEELGAIQEDDEEEEGITSQEEEFEEEEEELEEGVEFDGETEEGLDPGWDEEEEEEEEDEDDEKIEEEDDTGSMSPTDAMLDTMIAEEAKSLGALPPKDPICYHCGVLLVEPPLRISEETTPSPKISIPLHCEICVRGIHSQCHISLGGSLPTQEESFVCFHCRTSQHGKYEMKAADRVKVSVGPAHQVPLVPSMFFSASPLSVVKARPVQVWSADAAKSVIPDAQEIHLYLQRAGQIWPDRLRVNSSGGSLAAGSVRRLYLPRAAAGSAANAVLNHYWCPFSAEHAMTILHRSDYCIEKALKAIKSPLIRDCFASVCFPPSKPYYNKWKPKDRRWRMMKIPYPPSRVEAPMMDNTVNMYATQYEGEGPRLRSRRFHNYY